jgi:hypothetical protein
MRLQARVFVTTEGCRDEEASHELMRAAAAVLEELHKRRVIAGYRLSAIVAEDDYEEQDLDRPLIERETAGVLPALFLNVTYRIDGDPPDVDAIEPVITKYAFRHLLTDPEA